MTRSNSVDREPRRARGGLPRLAALAYVLVLVGCVPSGEWSEVPVPTGTPGGPQFVEPRSDLRDPMPVALSGWTVTEEGLVVTFPGSDPACTGADLQVHESADSVSVAVSLGSIPGAGPCSRRGVDLAMVVHLDTPLGERRVVDAHA